MTTNHPQNIVHRVENTNGRTSPPAAATGTTQSSTSVIDDFCSWLLARLASLLATLQAALEYLFRWSGTLCVRCFRQLCDVTYRFFHWLFSLNWLLILFTIVSVPPVALLYWHISAHGLRMQIPIFATRLYKLPLPGFSYLQDFQDLYMLDMAHVMAMLLLVFVWYFWTVVVHVIFHGRDTLVSPAERRSSYYVFLLTLAFVTVVCDATIFFWGLLEYTSGWGDSSPFVPFVATLLYSSLMASLAMIHVRLIARHNRRHKVNL